MRCGGRPIATPARTATCGLLAAVDTPLLESATGVLEKLPAELRREACLDLSRRLTPELQAWSLNQVIQGGFGADLLLILDEVLSFLSEVVSNSFFR